MKCSQGTRPPSSPALALSLLRTAVNRRLHPNDAATSVHQVAAELLPWLPDRGAWKLMWVGQAQVHNP